MTDWVARYHQALHMLHRNLSDWERTYYEAQATIARRAARACGQSASRVRWSYHPQPRIERSA